MRKLADLFKALGDETRLMMLALLLERPELCVCDFEGTLQISQSKASRHLQTLKHAGFLSDRREGLWVHYRISKDLSDDHKALVRVLRKMLSGERIETLFAQLDRWLEVKSGITPACSEARSEGRELR